MKIAVVAHDGMKEALLQFVMFHSPFFAKHQLIATRSTGDVLVRYGISCEKVEHGPLGGDIVLAAMASRKELDAVFFFRDHMSPQPHEHDVSAFLRIVDISNLPCATNQATAKCLVEALRDKE
jgi:methylglyoxal synthase